jgi:hypothetical protein
MRLRRKKPVVTEKLKKKPKPKSKLNSSESEIDVIPWANQRKKPTVVQYSSEQDSEDYNFQNQDYKENRQPPPKKRKELRRENSISSTSSDGSTPMVELLYCASCGYDQPSDNFSAIEQTRPKKGVNGRICLLHRSNSGVTPEVYKDSERGSRWSNTLNDIEKRYENMDQLDEELISVDEYSSTEAEEPPAYSYQDKPRPANPKSARAKNIILSDSDNS